MRTHALTEHTSSVCDIILAAWDCDELHLMSCSSLSYVLLVERNLVLVVVGRLPTQFMSPAIQIAWGHGLAVRHGNPPSTRCLKICLLAMVFEGMRCWWKIAQLRRSQPLCENLSCKHLCTHLLPSNSLLYNVVCHDDASFLVSDSYGANCNTNFNRVWTRPGYTKRFHTVPSVCTDAWPANVSVVPCSRQC